MQVKEDDVGTLPPGIIDCLLYRLLGVYCFKNTIAIDLQQLLHSSVLIEIFYEHDRWPVRVIPCHPFYLQDRPLISRDSMSCKIRLSIELAMPSEFLIDL
jgi:hypothetical protein